MSRVTWFLGAIGLLVTSGVWMLIVPSALSDPEETTVQRVTGAVAIGIVIVPMMGVAIYSLARLRHSRAKESPEASFWVGIALWSVSAHLWLLLVTVLVGDREDLGYALVGLAILTSVPIALAIPSLQRGLRVASAERHAGSQRGSFRFWAIGLVLFPPAAVVSGTVWATTQWEGLGWFTLGLVALFVSALWVITSPIEGRPDNQ